MRARHVAVWCLLVLAALARTAAVGLGGADPRDPRPAVLAAAGLAIAVPALLAVLVARRQAGARTAVVGLGALSAGLLVRTGLQVADGSLVGDPSTLLAAAAAAAQALAAGLVVAGWQDVGGPVRARPSPAAAALLGAFGLLAAVGLVVRPTAVLATGPDGTTAPVALAEAPSPVAVVLAVGLLAALWWGAGLVGAAQRRGAVAGAAAGVLVELVGTLALATVVGFLPVAASLGVAAALLLALLPLPGPRAAPGTPDDGHADQASSSSA